MPPNNTVCYVEPTPEDPYLFTMPVCRLFFVLLRSSLHIFLSFLYKIVEGRYADRLVFYENDQLMNYELIRVQYVATELEASRKARLMLK